jgi:hypothetical protein
LNALLLISKPPTTIALNHALKTPYAIQGKGLLNSSALTWANVTLAMTTIESTKTRSIIVPDNATRNLLVDLEVGMWDQPLRCVCAKHVKRENSKRMKITMARPASIIQSRIVVWTLSWQTLVAEHLNRNVCHAKTVCINLQTIIQNGTVSWKRH